MGMPRRTSPLLLGLLSSACAIALAGIVGYAVQQEIAPTRPVSPAVPLVGPTTPAPLTEAEEAYAESLWPLHQQVVEPSAGRLTFAGLAYATGDHDAQRLAAKLTPLRDAFRTAQAKVAGVAVPASMEGVQKRYLLCLSLYEQSATEMLNVARDGDDGHLVDAQRSSERAAEELVKVGDILWPGEHKPN